MKKLLHFKHWHIFLLTFILPMILSSVGSVIMVALMISKAKNGAPADPGEMFSSMKYIFIIALLPQLFHVLHFWSKGVHLQEYMPKGLTMKVNLFKASQLVPLLLLIIMFTGMAIFMEDLFSDIGNRSSYGDQPPFPASFFIFMTVMTPLNILSMFCSFYGFYFIAKTVKSIQLNKEAQFSDFIGEFFLLWFYIVGMWFTQPIVNDIVNGKYNKTDEVGLGLSDEEFFE